MIKRGPAEFHKRKVEMKGKFPVWLLVAPLVTFLLGLFVGGTTVALFARNRPKEKEVIEAVPPDGTLYLMRNFKKVLTDNEPSLLIAADGDALLELMWRLKDNDKAGVLAMIDRGRVYRTTEQFTKVKLIRRNPTTSHVTGSLNTADVELRDGPHRGKPATILADLLVADR